MQQTLFIIECLEKCGTKSLFKAQSEVNYIFLKIFSLVSQWALKLLLLQRPYAFKRRDQKLCICAVCDCASSKGGGLGGAV